MRPQSLLDGYLDDTLTPGELVQFESWIRESPENARELARAVLLHDGLRAELGAQAMLREPVVTVPRAAANVTRRATLRLAAALAGLAVPALILLALLWRGLMDPPAAAAAMELHRLIAASADSTVRTYQITVEEAVRPSRRPEGAEPPDDRRPPKPPMDGAVLHVRGKNQFVLVRTTREGLPFVTGCNGQTSWAVRPDGPVRVSSDLSRFNRDVPGHEQEMPLNDMEAALERLSTAFEIQLAPVETPEGDASPADDPLRLLVAVKRRGFRGPRRVELTYVVQTGEIRQLRFVDMPYGPDRLTLRLSRVDGPSLGDSDFDHAAHHGPDRRVELEE